VALPRYFVWLVKCHLHELPNQRETLQSIVKSSIRIVNAEDTPQLVNDSLINLQSGRPGSVTIQMCWDTMIKPAEVELILDAELPAPPAADPADIAAAKKLASAGDILIMVGNGAQHASEGVLALAELLDAPVTSFRSGRGIVAENHELGISSAVAHEL